MEAFPTNWRYCINRDWKKKKDAFMVCDIDLYSGEGGKHCRAYPCLSILQVILSKVWYVANTPMKLGKPIGILKHFAVCERRN
jgi:hypothetical protein